MISIAVIAAPHHPDVVRSVRSITGAPIAEISRAVKSGAPVFERELFDGRSGETFALLRRLLDEFDRIQVSLLVKEDGNVISTQILRNIMAASEESAAHLRDLDDLGHR